MASLCHPWFTTTDLSYRIPIFETSATALCGTTCESVQKVRSINRQYHLVTLNWTNSPDCSRTSAPCSAREVLPDVSLVNVRVECQDMTEYISENASGICGLYVKVDVCPTSCHHVFQSNYTQVKFARKNVIICCGNMKFANAKQCQNIRQKTCQTTCQTTCQSICQYSPKRCYNVLQLIFRICARVLSEYMPDAMSDFMSAKTFFLPE